jgi:hypothetical protein
MEFTLSTNEQHSSGLQNKIGEMGIASKRIINPNRIVMMMNCCEDDARPHTAAPFTT